MGSVFLIFHLIKVSIPDFDAYAEETFCSTELPADQSAVTELMLPALVQSPKIKCR